MLSYSGALLQQIRAQNKSLGLLNTLFARVDIQPIQKHTLVLVLYPGGQLDVGRSLRDIFKAWALDHDILSHHTDLGGVANYSGNPRRPFAEKVFHLDLLALYLDRDRKVCEYDLYLVSVALFDALYHALDYAARRVCHCKVALALPVRFDRYLVAVDCNRGRQLCEIFFYSAELAFYRKCVAFFYNLDA